MESDSFLKVEGETIFFSFFLFFCIQRLTSSTMTIAEQSDLSLLETGPLIEEDFHVKTPVLKRKEKPKNFFPPKNLIQEQIKTKP